MPIVILKPNSGGSPYWGIGTSQGERSANFGASKEINSDYIGSGYVLEKKTGNGWAAVNEFEAQIRIGDKTTRTITAVLELGGLHWYVDGTEITNTCQNCPDLPAEFNVAAQWSKVLVDGQEVAEVRAQKTE